MSYDLQIELQFSPLLLFYSARSQSILDFFTADLLFPFRTLKLWFFFCYPRLESYQIPPIQYFILPVYFKHSYFQPIPQVLWQHLPQISVFTPFRVLALLCLFSPLLFLSSVLRISCVAPELTLHFLCQGNQTARLDLIKQRLALLSCLASILFSIYHFVL